MFSKKIFLITLMAVLIILLCSTLFAEAETRGRRAMREITQNIREALGNSKNLFSAARMQRNDLAMSEHVYQFIDFYTWDWADSEKSIFSYDEDGNISVIYHYYWDEELEEWEVHPITSYLSWDANGLLRMISYRLVEDDFDIEFAVIHQNYNGAHQITYLGNEVYDHDSGELELDAEMEFFYDENGYAEQALRTDYAYMEYQRITIGYDSNERYSEIFHEFSDDGENWHNEQLSIVIYHSEDTSGYAEFQLFLNAMGLMVGYDDPIWLTMPMMIHSETYHYWSGDEWIPGERDLYTYYPDHKLESRIYEEHFGDDYWVPGDRALYTYDMQDYLEMINYQYYHIEDGWTDYGRYLITMAETSDADYHQLTPLKMNLTNYPNPFNPETTIHFELPASQEVELAIYNIKGQIVRTLLNDHLTAGSHHIVWNGRDDRGNSLSSGIYFYSLKSAQKTKTNKMLLLK